MDYYLGIDGGGTKTKVIVINETLELVYEHTSGPSSIDTVNQETTQFNIEKAVQPFFSHHPTLRFKAVFAGIGGIVFPNDERMVESLLRHMPFVDQSTVVYAKNDMYNALYSSNQFDHIMSLICGTGMVAFGKSGKNTHKAGGWGYLEGELGSGYHLGREAIRHCVRAFDHRVKQTPFAKDIASVIHMTQASDIIQINQVFHDQRTKTASLAPIVTKHANLGNPYAKAICDKAIDELVLAISAVYETLQFNHVKLVIIGSLGHAEGYFNTQLKTAILNHHPSIEIIDPILDPALAAAKAAYYFSEGKYAI